jgi:hypothetical protein
MFEKTIGSNPKKCLWIDFRGFFYGIKVGSTEKRSREAESSKETFLLSNFTTFQLLSSCGKIT